MKTLILFFALCSLVSNTMAADANQAPLVDLSNSQTTTNTAQVSHLTTQQRLARLENIVQNQSQLLTQLSGLQQSLQQLQGKVDELTNDNQRLRDQQRKLYADLDQRLRKQQSKTTQTKTATVTSHASTDTKQPQSLDEYKDYQNAYNLIVARQFSQAETTLNAFLKKYPKGSYTSNANYWLGEVYLAQGQADQAQQQFDYVVKTYPNDRKVPDAMLKLAFINYDKGKTEQAVSQLKAIGKRYPGSTAAQLAAAKLQVIQASHAG